MVPALFIEIYLFAMHLRSKESNFLFLATI